MGMYDSLYVKCPKCGKELELQSKSGSCGLFVYTKRDLPIGVALGLKGDVILCQFCNAHIEFVLKNSMKVRFELKIVKKKDYIYSGNYNPKHPISIKSRKDLDRFLKKAK